MKRRKIKMIPIKDTPTLKDLNTKIYGPGDVVLANGIISYFKEFMDADWLDSESDMSKYDMLMKIKYGDRHINSLGQYMQRPETSHNNSKFSDGCLMLWGIHHEEWDKLWNSYIAEYNPIWNVDGTESVTETRDLEDNHTGTDTFTQDGTVELARDGFNSDVTTGSYDDAKSGYDKTEHDGTDELEKLGSETTDFDANNDRDYASKTKETGTDTLSKEGTETNTHSGYIRDAGSETTAKSIFGFNSSAQSPSPSETETRTPNLSRQFDNEKNELTFNQRQDVDSKDLLTEILDDHIDEVKDESTVLSFSNRKDKETVDLDDKTTYNSTLTRTYNSNNPLTERHNFDSTDTQTYDKTDTNTKALKDTQEGTITTETVRQGNIGVTMTQQLLQADLDYWLSAKALFFENVIKDIVNDLCYKIQVDYYI